MRIGWFLVSFTGFFVLTGFAGLVLITFYSNYFFGITSLIIGVSGFIINQFILVPKFQNSGILDLELDDRHFSMKVKQ